MDVQDSPTSLNLFQLFHKFFAKHTALFFRLVASWPSALNCIANLLKKFVCEVFKRLSPSPTTAVGKEKHGWFSFNRFARFVPQINVIEKCLDRASDIREIIRRPECYSIGGKEFIECYASLVCAIPFAIQIFFPASLHMFYCFSAVFPQYIGISASFQQSSIVNLQSH